MAASSRLLFMPLVPHRLIHFWGAPHDLPLLARAQESVPQALAAATSRRQGARPPVRPRFARPRPARGAGRPQPDDLHRHIHRRLRVGSLRDQIQSANNNPGDDTIAFNLPAGSVIQLTSGPLVIQPTTDDDALTIDAGNNPVTIDDQNNTANISPPVRLGIFLINAPSGDVKLGGLDPGERGAAADHDGDAVHPGRRGELDDRRATLLLSSDTFLGNRADYGGAVFVQPSVAGGGSLMVDQCTFGQLVGGTADAGAANQATFGGGAIFFSGGGAGPSLGSLRVSNSQFYGSIVNQVGATSTAAAQGGAIYDRDAGSVQGMSILSSMFDGNRVIASLGGAAQGGAIYTTAGGPLSTTIDGSTFINNSARGGDLGGTVGGGPANGGAVFDQAAVEVFSNDSFGQPGANNGNTATGGDATGTSGMGGTGAGGAIYTEPTSLTVSNGTTFYGNHANGGASAGSNYGGFSEGAPSGRPSLTRRRSTACSTRTPPPAAPAAASAASAAPARGVRSTTTACSGSTSPGSMATPSTAAPAASAATAAPPRGGRSGRAKPAPTPPCRSPPRRS